MQSRNFVKTVSESIRHNWDVPAYSDYEGESYSYAEVAEKIVKFHILFEKHNIKQGSKVALIGKNSKNWAVSYFATILYGAVIVPILPDFLPEDVHYILEHSESEVLFASEEWYKQLDPEKLKSLRAQFNLNDFSLVESQEKGLNADLEKIDQLFKEKYPDGFTSDLFTVPEVSNDQIACINYTSGTAGHSKGVVLSFTSFMGNLQYAQENMPLEAGNKIVSFLPLAHAYGCAFDFIFPSTLGCHITFLSKIPSPQIILKAFQEIKPELVMFVPLVLEKIYKTRLLPVISKPVMRFLLAIPGINGILFKKIRNTLNDSFGGHFREIVIGGAALNPEVEAFLKRIKFKFAVGYGMTECGPLVSYAPWDKHRNGSSGKVVDALEMKIDSKDPYNEVGEIMVKGDHVMNGYYKNDEATRKAITEDGWLRTGDLGVFDKDHFIYIKGRSKSMILGPSGQNIYPEEIESKLNNLPYIVETVVIERNHKIVALVYPDYEPVNAGQMSEQMLQEHMRKLRDQVNEKLPKYMQISEMELVKEEFEKTPKKSIKRYKYQ